MSIIYPINRKGPIKGYYWRADRQGWQVRFTVHGKLKYYGLYGSETVAKEQAEIVKQLLRKHLCK